MPSRYSRVETGLTETIRAYRELQSRRGGREFPIDLTVMVEAIGNIDLEEREMIPER